ncbi:MAG TPA: adenosylcobinamide-GDP ribazoletransferase [Angustibacter sp.]|nr:adenosylcobinamide-GDP ribazoletransferase [Angustibacter sp.]
MSRRADVSDGLRLALGTLTALRVPPPSRVDRAVAGVGMLLAPVAALVPAAAVALVLAAGTALQAPPLLGGALTVGALALSTRGLHLDGLADTADGLGSSYDRDRALAVMRTGDVGPMGTATLVVVLLGQAAGLSALGSLTWWRAALVAAVGVVVSRSMLSIACAAGVRAARPDGLGATVAGSVRRAWAVLAALVVAAVSSTALALAGLAWWLGVVVVVACAATTATLLVRCTSRFGGITGDVLGAVVELSLLAAWTVLAVGVAAGTGMGTGMGAANLG